MAESGKVNGDTIVHFDSVEVRGMVPQGLWREAMLCGAANGLNKAEILRAALMAYVSDPGTQAIKQGFLARQAEQYDVSEYDICAKILGAYKDVARRKRANLPSPEDS